nr:hypothetical protein [Tanacetum cinerariifolium]
MADVASSSGMKNLANYNETTIVTSNPFDVLNMVEKDVRATPSDTVCSKGNMADVNATSSSMSGGGSGKSSLYERWKQTYDDNPYDDNESEDLTPQQLAFCDAFDIMLPSLCRLRRYPLWLADAVTGGILLHFLTLEDSGTELCALLISRCLILFALQTSGESIYVCAKAHGPSLVMVFIACRPEPQFPKLWMFLLPAIAIFSKIQQWKALTTEVVNYLDEIQVIFTLTDYLNTYMDVGDYQCVVIPKGGPTKAVCKNSACPCVCPFTVRRYPLWLADAVTGGILLHFLTLEDSGTELCALLISRCLILFALQTSGESIYVCAKAHGPSLVMVFIACRPEPQFPKLWMFLLPVHVVVLQRHHENQYDVSSSQQWKALTTEVVNYLDEIQVIFTLTDYLNTYMDVGDYQCVVIPKGMNICSIQFQVMMTFVIGGVSFQSV